MRNRLIYKFKRIWGLVNLYRTKWAKGVGSLARNQSQGGSQFAKFLRQKCIFCYQILHEIS